MITLVWRTDVHMADMPPQSRTDDWAATILGKLNQVGDIARDVKANAVLDGGDFFHVKSPTRNSHEMVRRVTEVHAAYPCPVYANVGNHDVKYGSMEYLSESPLAVLFESGVFKRCYDQHEAVFVQDGVKVRVVGIPYHGTKYDMNRFTSLVRQDEDRLVVMVHCLASAKGGTMFEAEDVIGYNQLANLGPDVWCFLPGTKILDCIGRQIGIEQVFASQPILGREGAISIEQVHPVRQVDEEVVRFDVEGVPPNLIAGVTLEHPFWVAQNMRCVLPSRNTRRCHLDKPRNAYPCRTCTTQSSVKADWVKAGDVVSGDYVAVPVPKIPKVSQPVPGLARLLGLYLAEGHLIQDLKGNPIAGVGWSFHEDETDLQVDVERLVHAHFGLGVKRHKTTGRCIQVCAYGSDVAAFCLGNGGRHSDKKELSAWVWDLSAIDRMELLIGWLDGDGHARDPAKYRRIKVEVLGATVSPNLASQMYLLALSIGLRPYYTIRPAGKAVFWKGTEDECTSETKPVHIISFYGTDADALSERMGVTFPVRSKTKVAGFFHNGLYYVRVRAVERFRYKGPVHNMRTSTQEYVAGMFLTHNCFGHWHKNQGVTEIAKNKHVVNVGSLSRGSISQDDLARTPSCVVMRFSKDTVTFETIALKVAKPEDVFNLEARERKNTRNMTMEAVVDRLKSQLTMRESGSVIDTVREATSISEDIRERTIHYLERAGAR